MKVEIRKSSKRRTISLKIEQGQVVVLAPERTSERKIESILKEHQSWITKQLLKWETQAADLKTKVFEPGGIS